MDKYSHAGYAFWFGLIEIICNQIGTDLTKNFECSPTYLKRKLRISSRKVREMLEFSQRKGKLICKFNKETWEIGLPKIAEIKDNYTKDLQVTSKKLSLDKEENKNKIKKKNKNKEEEEIIEVVLITIPDYINQDTWQSFVTMRKEIKKPLTDNAIKLALSKLDKFKTQGYDVNEIINESILNNWSGLFEPKGKPKKTGKFNVNDKDYREGVNEDGTF